LVVLLALGAFIVGRKFQKRRALSNQKTRIDAMLEQARTAATPLLGSEPVLPISRAAAGERTHTPAAAAAPVRSVEGTNGYGSTIGKTGRATQTDFDPTLTIPDIKAAPQPSPPARFAAPDEPTAALRLEMDDAMDNTRSMFSDIDRFITLGRIENAISLLEFQIKREPDDRGSWIKLMAVYRHQGMDDDFERIYAGFRDQFGDNARL